jgi:hypothetical protein
VSFAPGCRAYMATTSVPRFVGSRRGGGRRLHPVGRREEGEPRRHRRRDAAHLGSRPGPPPRARTGSWDAAVEWSRRWRDSLGRGGGGRREEMRAARSFFFSGGCRDRRGKAKRSLLMPTQVGGRRLADLVEI